MKVRKIVLGVLIPLMLSLFIDGCINGGEPGPVDCEFSDLGITISTFSEPTGCINDGSITVAASGGVEPYEFSVDDGVFQLSTTFSMLSPGDHKLMVKDKNGCTAMVTKLFIAPGAPTATLVQTENSNCLSPYNGTIEVTGVSGGTGPYMYKLDDGIYGSSTLFEGLRDGIHTVTVKDNAGCEVPLLIEVARGNTGITYTGDVKAIFEAKCLLSGCHLNNTNGKGDWGIYSEAFQKRALIKSRTQDGSMPAVGSLTEEQKALIACWVDDGAPEN